MTDAKPVITGPDGTQHTLEAKTPAGEYVVTSRPGPAADLEADAAPEPEAGG